MGFFSAVCKLLDAVRVLLSLLLQHEGRLLRVYIPTNFMIGSLNLYRLMG